jgi:hypothetical protein
LRIGLRLLRRWFAWTVAIGIVVARALGFAAPGIVVDAGNLNGAAVGIDANGAAAIFEGVLGLRCGARQQQRGDSQ